MAYIIRRSLERGHKLRFGGESLPRSYRGDAGADPAPASNNARQAQRQCNRLVSGRSRVQILASGSTRSCSASASGLSLTLCCPVHESRVVKLTIGARLRRRTGSIHAVVGKPVHPPRSDRGACRFESDLPHQFMLPEHIRTCTRLVSERESVRSRLAAPFSRRKDGARFHKPCSIGSTPVAGTNSASAQVSGSAL